MWIELSAFSSLLLSAVLAAGFVLSLYVWRDALKHNRDDPAVIRKRFASLSVACLVSVLMVYVVARDAPPKNMAQVVGDGPGLLTWIGLPANVSALLLSAFLPLFLTAVIFFGPIVVYLYSDSIPSLLQAGVSLLSPANRLFTLRNLVLGPLFEEIVFRGCVCSIMIAGGWGEGFTVLASPILFGLAHVHHLLDMVRSRGYSMKQAIQAAVFQLSYSTIFGIYASFLFIRTGTLIAPTICHSFCNLLGFPDLMFLVKSSHPAYKIKTTVIVCYLAGIIVFCKLLYPLTSPHLYNSWLHQLLVLKQSHA